MTGASESMSLTTIVSLGIPATKAPFNVATFISYVLPVVFFYVVMAVLAVTQQTRTLRMAIMPVIALLAWRASFSVDMAPYSDRKFYNDLSHPMFFLANRALFWAMSKEQFVRRLRPANSSPSTLMDAADLALTFRGYGWDWSRGLYVPRETRPSGRTRFVFHVTLSAVVHAFIYGTSHRAIRSFSPAGLGDISGASIFDETLPVHIRYFRSSILALLGFFATHSMLQMFYDVCTLVGILCLGQDPAQWPPAFDSPWRATSLSDFWARRWHQFLRHTFLIEAGYLLSFFFGRAGFVFGAFLSSAMYHHLGFYTIDSTSECWRMVLGFGMMVPGVLAEQTLKRWTGRKVGGWVGWVWTMSWLMIGGNVLIDGFVRAGTYRYPTLIDGLARWRALVERIVMDFDTWLHMT